MIYSFTGTPGYGKTYEAVKTTLDELRKGGTPEKKMAILHWSAVSDEIIMAGSRITKLSK